MEEVSNFCPAMAVPITVKMPEPMTAPMPSAVSDERAKCLLQPVFRFFRIGDQLVDGLAAKKLVALPCGCVALGDGLCQETRSPSHAFQMRGIEARTRSARASVNLLSASSSYRFAWPRASFFTLRFFDPRA